MTVTPEGIAVVVAIVTLWRIGGAIGRGATALQEIAKTHKDRDAREAAMFGRSATTDREDVR